MTARKIATQILLTLAPIALGKVGEFFGYTEIQNRFALVIILSSFGGAVLASREFLVSRRRKPSQIEKGWNAWVGAATIGWVALLYYSLGPIHIFWVLVVLSLFQFQLLIWFRYPKLEQRKLSQKELSFFLGIPLVSMIIFVGMVGVIGLDQPPKEPDNMWKWAQIIGLGLLSVPVGMIAGMFRMAKPLRIAKVVVSGNSTVEELFSYFNWTDAETSRIVLERLKKFRSYDLIPQLEALKEKMPRAFYHLTFDQILQLEGLENTYQEEIRACLKPNIPFQEAKELCWCRQCATRTTEIQLASYPLRVCRFCQTDNNLIFPVKKVIGVLGNGESVPAPSGIWHFQSWNDGSDTFVPADYDEILLKGDFPLNYDWYIVAMANWLDNYFAATGKPITLTIMRAPELSENALKLLEAAEAEGKLMRKYQ